jgi:transposase
VRALLACAPVLHADETTGRAAGKLSYVHVACTEYLTVMHVGGHTKGDIDAGGVLPEFTGALVRDGYPELQASDPGRACLVRGRTYCGTCGRCPMPTPQGQLWALALADTLIEAHHAARDARGRGADRLDEHPVRTIRNHYLGALARGHDDNQGKRGTLATDARALIRRFRDSRT